MRRSGETRVYLSSRLEPAELTGFDVCFVTQRAVFDTFFDVEEVKTTLVAAQLVFPLQTHKLV